MTAIGLLFSGQGAQAVGMAKSLYDNVSVAKECFDRANDVLGFDLKKACFDGPESTLTETRVCQPALYTHGYVLYRILEHAGKLEGLKVALGLSLGELTALAVAGVFDFETGLRIVAERGRLMQDACNQSHGGMVSFIGGSQELVEEVCQTFDLDIANINSPGQIVVSGDRERTLQAAAKAKELGFKMAIPLNVAGAYHSRLMEPARAAFEVYLSTIPFKAPHIHVFSNTTGTIVNRPEDIKEALVRQVVSTVRWVECMEGARDLQVNDFYECGPGAVLTGLGRRIDKNLAITPLSEYQDIQRLA